VEEPIRKIFIAGTGRSGTTLLHDLIGHHPAVHGIPGETKFIVEGDGLSGLVSALADSFSVTQADLTFLRFLTLMGHPMPNPPWPESPEFGQSLAQGIGPEIYHAALSRYVQALTDFRFAFDPTFGANPYPRHFEDRAELVALTRALVAEMFDGATRAAGKRVWCEKTPSNLIAMDFLWELFPEARILHITRDPRGVLHSLLQQDWAPHEPAEAARFLRHIYVAWARLKPRLDLDPGRYLEIRLEDFCRDSRAGLARVLDFLGLPQTHWTPEADLKKVDYWKADMSAANQALALDVLGEFFPLMGYSVHET